jgi:hypothetical protein
MVKRRKKLWELGDQFHCSLVGTCLDLVELRRLGRKLGIPNEVLVDDYRIHTAFVGLVGEKNGGARVVGKHLDRKYRKQIHSLVGAEDEAALEKAWKVAVDAGDVAGTYWALLTHPAATEAIKYQVYGEVHMLSHLSGASVRVNMERLRRLRRRVPELEAELQAQRRDALSVTEKKNREIQQLRNRIGEMKGQLDFMRQQLAHAEEKGTVGKSRNKDEAQLSRLKMQLERAEAETRRWRVIADSWREQKEQQRCLAEQAAKERDALEHHLERLLAPDCDHCSNAENCDRNLDLCNRRILFVGGRDRQCAHFRALVEKGNGCFLHHDGGLEESGHRLGALLARADAVLCPLDCISHDAVNRIKQDCKRYGKPLKLLPRASLAAFTRGLREVATG